MSMPAFPEKPEGYSIEDSIAQLLTSVAMEEIGLSHIINSEGEKLQYVLGTLPGSSGLNPTINELIEVNESIKDMLGIVSTNQMFLFGKMSSALNAHYKSKNSSDPNEKCPACPDKPLNVMIITNKGKIYGNDLYLPQGTKAELNAIVITGGDEKAVWTYGSQPGVSISVHNNKAAVRIASDAAVGSSLAVKAASAADSSKYDIKTIIVIDATVKDIVIGGNGKLYADYGDNTFREMDRDGIITGGLVCGGMDRIPGTADDRDDVVVSDSGIKYLGPNTDNSYQKAGPDGLLGTEDDKFVWQRDINDRIAPCNETETTEDIQVRNILIQPASAEVSRESSLQFTAMVYRSDDSIDPAGVTWELRDVRPDGSAFITEEGLLTVGPDAYRLTVVAISKTNTELAQPAAVKVKLEIQDVPTAVEGRILDPSKTGDNTDWIEIAQNGGYSLIVRKKYINISSQDTIYNNPQYQYIRFGSDALYATSEVREKINKWFQGLAADQADNLDREANLRQFTVKNTSLEEIGTGAAGPEGKNDGFSKPVEVLDPMGPDVAFALSYGEAVNFVSREYASGGGAYRQSSSIAAENFSELQIPSDRIEYGRLWLRSPGGMEESMSTLSSDGKVFRTPIDGSTNEFGLLYPAVWVDSAIFD